MGGMAAFTPGKTAELRAEQTAKVMADKKREAEWGHDGCWVSHPYFIGVAMEAMNFENQLHVKTNFDKYSDILPRGDGPHTLSGLRTNIRVGIAYMNGWEQDIGCVAFDNLMEDLATLEISRAQVWQWLHHGITLDEGNKVTKELVSRIFDEEFEKINAEFPVDKKIRDKAFEIFTSEKLNNFLTTASERV